jgi:hypothetical protein
MTVYRIRNWSELYENNRTRQLVDMQWVPIPNKHDGNNPLLRIALCGYEGEHDMPKEWDCVAWKAVGGYGNQSENNENARRERIWFSPHCISSGLFDGLLA